jgi:hypothetical protein
MWRSSGSTPAHGSTSRSSRHGARRDASGSRACGRDGDSSLRSRGPTQLITVLTPCRDEETISGRDPGGYEAYRRPDRCRRSTSRPYHTIERPTNRRWLCPQFKDCGQREPINVLAPWVRVGQRCHKPYGVVPRPDSSGATVCLCQALVVCDEAASHRFTIVHERRSPACFGQSE